LILTILQHLLVTLLTDGDILLAVSSVAVEPDIELNDKSELSNDESIVGWIPDRRNYKETIELFLEVADPREVAQP
jgi:hypothetical protein